MFIQGLCVNSMHICWVDIICWIWLTVCETWQFKNSYLLRMWICTEDDPFKTSLEHRLAQRSSQSARFLQGRWMSRANPESIFIQFAEFAWCLTIFNHCWILLDIPCVELRSVNCCPLEISIDFPGVHCKLPLEIAVHWKLLSIGNEEVLHSEIWIGKTDENTGFGSVRQIAREPNHKPNHEEKRWNTIGNCWGRVMFLP